MSGNIVYTPGASTLRGMTPAQDFSVAVRETPTAIPSPGGSLATVQDRVMRTTTQAASDNNCQFVAQSAQLGGQDPEVSWSAVDPSVALVTPGGAVTRVTDGLARFEASGIYGKRRYSRQMVRTGGGPITVFDSYASGSLARHVVDQMAALVSGKTPSDATRLNYSARSGDFANPTLVRNASNFAASIDLSGMSVWRSDANNYGYWPAALVSTRHFIASNHVAGGNNFGYCWMTPAGAFAKANCIGYYVIPGTDLQIGYLDQDIPVGVKRFKVLPYNFAAYLPSTVDYQIPSLSKRQAIGDDSGAWISTATYDALRILPVCLKDTLTSSYGTVPYANCPVIGQLDPASQFAAWEVPLHTGDSSGPCWLVINGEAVLLGTYADVQGCPHVGNYITQIEAAMNSLAASRGDATVYSLAKVNLSGFPTF